MFFRPGTWLDDEVKARTRQRCVALPVTAFAHQAIFTGPRFADRVISDIRWRRTTRCAPREPAPAADGGTVAMLPGSRGGELRCHVPLLLARVCASSAGAGPHLRGDDSVRPTSAPEQRIAQTIARDTGYREVRRRARRRVRRLPTRTPPGSPRERPCSRSALLRRSRGRALRDHAGAGQTRPRDDQARFITLPNLVLGREVDSGAAAGRRNAASAWRRRWKRCCSDPASAIRSNSRSCAKRSGPPRCARNAARGSRCALCEVGAAAGP